MSEVESRESRVESLKSKAKSPILEVEELDSEDLAVIDGELIEDSPATVSKKNLARHEDPKPKTKLIGKESKSIVKAPNNQSAIRNYLLLPFIFLTVTLLGGLRLSADTSAFIFLKPALICLIFASLLLLLFFRANLLRLEGWFSENFSTLKNIADAFVLLTLFTASVQLFNSLLPEKGLPFWIIALLFLWTLWNNLFSVFEPKRLLQSLASLFGLAFIIKYLILASLSFASGETTITQKILETVMKEASFGLLELPKFSPGTGYIQFFAVGFYLVGLFLLKPDLSEDEK